MASQRPQLSVVVPCLNERENIGPLIARLKPILEDVASGNFEIIFVDDGSVDGSDAMLDALYSGDHRVRVIHFSRNFGHQAALCAGMEASSGEAVVLMDCDLQDPPKVLKLFVERWREGYEVVYGIRRMRKENVFKRAAYAIFYRTMRAMAGIDVPLDAGDFCLMDRRVVNVLVGLPESHRFLRGLRSWIGFRQIGVPYDRHSRHLGDPKYTTAKLMQLALSGYVGFSMVPLRAAVWLGLLTAGGGVGLLAWALLTIVLDIPSPRGWVSTIAVILVVGGVQLIVLSIIGEYLGHVFDEVRRRPAYIIHRSVGLDAATGDRPSLTGARARD